MVKMTKYQIENNLINLIQNNDYENLELFFLENQEVDINLELTKKRDGLLGFAIFNKSKECFDWILAHPKFTLKNIKPIEDFKLEDIDYILYNRDDSDDDSDDENNNDSDTDDNDNINNSDTDDDDNDNNINEDSDNDNELDYKLKFKMNSYRYNMMLGINEALKIFNRAPNYANSYYLRSLLNAGIYIYPNIIIALENYSDIYNLALQNINISPNYLKNMLFNQVHNTRSLRVIDTFEKVKGHLNKKELSYLIKESIIRKQLTWLKYFISNCDKPINIYIGKYKSDILTFCIYAMREDKKSLVNPTIEIVLEYIKLNPLNSDNFDSKYFIRNFLFGSNPILIAKNYDNLKQINIPVDLSVYVKDVILKWIESNWCKINYSNLNIILKLGWCKSNVFDHLTNIDIKKIEKEADSANDYYRTNDNLKVFYHIAYIFHLNKMDMGTNSLKLFKLFKFDSDIYSTDLLKSWAENNLIKIEHEETLIDIDTSEIIKDKLTNLTNKQTNKTNLTNKQTNKTNKPNKTNHNNKTNKPNKDIDI